MTTTPLSLTLVLILAACQATPPPPSPGDASIAPVPVAPPPPAAGASAPPSGTASAPALTSWDADGRVYAGEPLPGRGGSYRYLFCPNGKYQRWCLDAACDAGSYTRAGTRIALRSGRPEGKDQTLTLSGDERKLDDGLGMGTLTFAGPSKQASACAAPATPGR